MKIKKFGQCCLLIEIEGKRVLTDPGSFTVDQNTLTDIDIVLITHEHGDHFHVESVKQIMSNNPNVELVTNSGVGKHLDEMGIQYTLLEKRDSQEISGVLLEAFDHKHEEIFEEVGQVQNTGYFIGSELFYPGDSYCNPGKRVPVLALPVAGPWCKIPDALRYAIEVRPTKAFPVHDFMLKETTLGFLYSMTEQLLKSKGIEFVPLKAGEEKEF